MALPWKRWTRKIHRWGALVTFIPLTLVIVTGLLLQVKKQVAWVQPPTVRGSSDRPEIGWQKILKAVQSVEQANVNSWNDVDRMDVRPGKGMVKVRAKNRWEVQVDLASGDVLASNYRRSDLIESLHDGSFFSEGAKLWVFLPNGIILFCLLVTGAYLWWMPIGARRNKARNKNIST